MNKDQIKLLLSNYHALIAKVDHHINRITEAFPNQIACKKGCDTCCKFLTLFPVEAIALSDAFSSLSVEIKTRVIRKIEQEKKTCPLLIDRECVLYPARPIICRTHGYPIYLKKGEEWVIDFCPENFKGVTSFQKDMLLDIEQLNTVLSVVNGHFIKSMGTDLPFSDRTPVSEAIFLLCHSKD